MNNAVNETECRHVFICGNNKVHGKSCAAFGAEEMYVYLKGELNRVRHLIEDKRRIKIVRTSCLGQCAFGPNIFITPDNIWYTYENKDDVDEILQKHFVLGQKVQRLINTGIHKYAESI